MAIERVNDVVRYLDELGQERGTALVVVTLPSSLLTDTDDGNPRIRVDTAQTGFFAGHQFRTFKEWVTATSGTYIIRATVPLDIILFELFIELEDGTARVETVVGGTPGGTFGEVLPVIPSNTMGERPQPPYEPQLELHAGGTLMGGTLLDTLRIKTANNSNFAASVGALLCAHRGRVHLGLPAKDPSDPTFVAYEDIN